jgi:uncharacterized protein YjbI with pentapeptide repeats
VIDSYLAIANSPLLWVFLIMVAAAFGIMKVTTLEVKRIDLNTSWLRKNYVGLLMGAATLLAASALYFYLIGIGLSLSGLVTRLRNNVSDPNTSPEDLRHLGTTVALLMGVLAAAATIIFSIIRVWINERTASAAEEALFNEKINNAVNDLHAQRQITKWLRTGAQNGWQDDVTRRNGAIDRLEGLAGEEPKAAPRIARMLSVYVRELSLEHPAKTVPTSDDPEVIRDWARALTPARSDMQNAVHVLGRLKKATGLPLDRGEIDLTGTNLQGFDFTGLDFDNVKLERAQLQGANLNRAQLQGANLNRAQLQGANLNGAQLQGARLSRAQLQGARLNRAQLQGANLNWAQLQGASLNGAELQGANLNGAELQGASLNGAQLQGARLNGAQLQGARLNGAKLQGANLIGAKFDSITSFRAATLRGAALRDVNFTQINIKPDQITDTFGDATVTLPGGHGPDHENWPKRWSKEDLDWHDFPTQWRAFQRSIGQDPDNPT